LINTKILGNGTVFTGTGQVQNFGNILSSQVTTTFNVFTNNYQNFSVSSGGITFGAGGFFNGSFAVCTHTPKELKN
jgi:hypothetical protein